MKVVVKMKVGSHLFGTSTPESDLDYKGLYLPEADQIILGTAPCTIQKSTGNDNSKNSKDDIDEEYYSLAKFFKLLAQGQTNAIEMLYAPEEMILETSDLWKELQSRRSEFISKNICSMISYARQQANKYGIKGSRMGELNNIIELFKNIEKKVDFAGPKLKHCWKTVLFEVSNLDHVNIIELNTSKNMENVKIPSIDILGKKFDWHCRFDYIIPILKKIYKNYGQRAREAKNNNGVDFKALSHSVRVSYQGIELLKTGHITLPLAPEHRKIIMDVKLECKFQLIYDWRSKKWK